MCARECRSSRVTSLAIGRVTDTSPVGPTALGRRAIARVPRLLLLLADFDQLTVVCVDLGGLCRINGLSPQLLVAG